METNWLWIDISIKVINGIDHHPLIFVNQWRGVDVFYGGDKLEQGKFI